MIMDSIHVLIVDDMTLVRQGIRSLLNGSTGVSNGVVVVGEAADGGEAAELVLTLVPDVVLLDHDMPGLDAPQAISLLKRKREQLEVIVLSESPDPERAFRTLEAGATGYVLKDISADNLIRAIVGVCNGRTVIHPYIARQLVERFRTMLRDRSNHDGVRPGGLTQRELEIIVEMARGATDREIADKSQLAESTVKSHIRSILRKVGARNRTQAVAFVLRKGLMR